MPVFTALGHLQNAYFGVLAFISAFQSLKGLRRDFRDILELQIFLQRLQKLRRRSDGVLETIKTSQSLEFSQSLFATVLEVKLERYFRRV
jgi:hypothetical protein